VLAAVGDAGYLILFAPWRPHGGQSLQQLHADFCGTMPVGSTEESVLKFLTERKEKHSVPTTGDHAISAFLGNTGLTVFLTARPQRDSNSAMTSAYPLVTYLKPVSLRKAAVRHGPARVNEGASMKTGTSTKRPRFAALLSGVAQRVR
jgi:hypothetical protein